MSIIDTLNNVNKTLSSATYIDGAILQNENLSQEIVNLLNRQTPVRDRLPRVAGSGWAASWNVLTAMWVGNSAFAEWALPTEDATSCVRRHAVYKLLWKTKSITDYAIKTWASFIDLAAQELEVAMLEVIKDEEQFIITWDTAVSALQFDGIKKTIVTNVIDDNNNALGYRADLINQAIELLQTNYGVNPTVILDWFGMQRVINDSLSPNRFIAGNSATSWITIQNFASSAWLLDFVTTPAIKWDAVTFAWNTVESIYVITENVSSNVVYMSDLMGLRQDDIGKVNSSYKFFVSEYTVLVNRAEEFHVEIQNVRVK